MLCTDPNNTDIITIPQIISNLCLNRKTKHVCNSFGALPQDGMLRYSTILAMIPQGLPKFEFSSALCIYIYVLYTGYQTNVYHCASDNTQSRKGCPYFQSIHSLQLRATRINHFRANDFN